MRAKSPCEAGSLPVASSPFVHLVKNMGPPRMGAAAAFRTRLVLRLAAPPAIGQELRLNDMIAEARANNREIAAAQKRYEAARQHPSRASSLPDPLFSPDWTSNGNPLPGAQLGVSPMSL